jgi:hypothetical protein
MWPWLSRLTAAWTLCLGLIAAVFAGAWTQEPGGYYLKMASHYLSSRSNFDSEGLRVRKPGMGHLTDFNLHAYLEYGLRDRLTLVVAAPYKRLAEVRRFAGGLGREKSRGLGDLEMGLRWKLADRPAVTSLALGGHVPLGYTVDNTMRLPLGTGQPKGDIRLLLGRSLHPFPAYLTGELGYRVRGGAYGDEFFYSLEAGFSRRRLLLKGYVSGLRTLGTCGAAGQTGLVGDQDLLKVSPGLAYRLHERVHLGVELIHIASGCNTTTGTTLSAGVAFRG